MHCHCVFFFFFNATATTEIYTLSLHDALPIKSSTSSMPTDSRTRLSSMPSVARISDGNDACVMIRSEEHTSELQSHSELVCRLLLEKKKKKTTQNSSPDINRYLCHRRS